MEKNNKKRYDLPRYEKMFQRLEKALEYYFKLKNGYNIRGFNENLRNKNNSGFENELIINSNNKYEIEEKIKESYLSRDYLNGEICLVDADEQYDGIINLTLYTLLVNRIGHDFKYEKDNNYMLPEKIREMYTEKYQKFMSAKTSTLEKLIYSIYMYKELENDNDFFYGYSTDDKTGVPYFIIDLPRYGQISFHFGNFLNFEDIKNTATKTARIILDRKRDLGLITPEKYNSMKEDLSNDRILPKYTGTLYEYSCGIPLEFDNHDYGMEKSKKILNLEHTLISNISEDKIKEIAQNKELNPREIYYYAVKNEFTKSQLELLSTELKNRNRQDKNNIDKNEFARQLGKNALSATTAAERYVVNEHEKSQKENCIDGEKDNGNSLFY